VGKTGFNEGSMNLFIEQADEAVVVEERLDVLARQARARRRTWVGTTIRVFTASTFVGQILLDTNDRVRRHASDIPSDVVLKVLIERTRQGETCGKLVGRKDGQTYYWQVVGAESEVA
jgi:hypothetical protein